jgi:pimeloyl-ACP methyl ester carboxylesterase
VFIHGAWVDGRIWEKVVPGLAESFRVVTYDERGHGRSGGKPEEGTVHDDVADAAALIERIGPPANVLGSSSGAILALRLTIERPELVRRTVAHEPPYLALIAEDPKAGPMLGEVGAAMDGVGQLLAAGDRAGAAERFAEGVMGTPGEWSRLPREIQDTFIHHAPTFQGQLTDPELLVPDVEGLKRIATPVLLLDGDASPPFFPLVVERLAVLIPHAQRHTFAGGDHLVHLTHEDEYARVVTNFLRST